MNLHLLGPDNLFNDRRVQLATLAVRHALPAIYSSREFAEAGGLMSYQVFRIDAGRDSDLKPATISELKPATIPR